MNRWPWKMGGPAICHALLQGSAKEVVSTLGTGSDASEQVNRLLGHAGRKENV